MFTGRIMVPERPRAQVFKQPQPQLKHPWHRGRRRINHCDAYTVTVQGRSKDIIFPRMHCQSGRR